MNTIEINYKCISRWHRTPEVIHRYRKDKTQLCWREYGQIGTTTHIWWDCPKIKEYWQEIREYVEVITGEKISNSIQACVFHKSKESNTSYRKTLTPPLINAAKGLITKNWLSTNKMI